MLRQRRRADGRDEAEPSQQNGHIPDATSASSPVEEAPDWEACIPPESWDDVEKSLPKRLLHWGPLIALALIFQIGLTATFFSLQWWPIDSRWGVVHLLAFLSWNYSTLVNISRAAYVGGGYVPKGWRPVDPTHEQRLQWCTVCEGFKVPRSHHCSKCGRCVMKMDHHCRELRSKFDPLCSAWINNCVGHRNHAFFVRFLASAVAGCIHAVIIIGFSIYHAVHREWYARFGTGNEPRVLLTWWSLLSGVLAFTLGAGVTLAVGFLLFYQLKYIIANRTGVEEYIVLKAERRREEEGEAPFAFPYSLGWRRNLSEVLLTWSGVPKGNGVWWPVRSGHSQFELSCIEHCSETLGGSFASLVPSIITALQEEQLAQKLSKRAHARAVHITRAFGGGCCGALTERGLRSFCCQPWSEEARVAVKEGQTWLVTRGTKHWLYGIRVEALAEEDSDRGLDPVLIHGLRFVPVEPQEKGWMPRDAVSIVPRESSSEEEESTADTRTS